ncbi:MAG: imidazole glycerol phosphate synthase subunit HisH, partial [Alphaproteobacteria bacterium]|nr:imidazole glycerol phosphate synthase subunit HisH [Alphaproteobacteria bacterium]
VGTASAAMAQLRAKGLIDTLRTLTQPVLGICLGLQLLFECSAEGDGTECLSVLSGTIERLPATPAEPVPHIGWNQLNCHFQNHPLLKGVLEGDYVYFVHSYAAPISDLTVASTTYGSAFTALAAQRNFMGCQFHPERSGAVGNQILANFLSL